MFRLRCVALGLLLGMPAAATAQPKAYVSTNPKPPAANSDKPDGLVSVIAVRPNTQIPFFVNVSNAGDERKAVTVLVSLDRDGKQLVAKGVVDLPKDGSARVALAPIAAPAEAPKPAAPPADKAAPEKAPAPQAPPGTPIAGQLFLLLREQDEPIKDVPPVPVRVRILAPSDYLYARPATPPSASGVDLLVEVGDRFLVETAADKQTFRGPSARLRLDLRPELIPNLDPASLKEGTFETFVAPGQGKVYLMAKNLRFTGPRRTSTIFVTADGYDRAFTFETDFSGSNPRADDKAQIRIDCPQYGVPGKPLAARLEVWNTPDAGEPRLKFFRTPVNVDPAAEPEVLTPNAATSRDQAIAAAVGKAGELLVGSVVRDWVVPLQTEGVFGSRDLVFTLDTNTAKHTFTLDSTPPENLKFAVPVSVERGKPIELFASADEKESAIGKVVFYLGVSPLADDKPAPNGRVEMGVVFIPPPPKASDPKDAKTIPPPAPGPTRYKAVFPTPDTGSRVLVGVRVTNVVGLTTETTAEVLIVEPPTTGTIAGKVIQGTTERPQPGLTVTLFDAAGRPAMVAATGPKGEFKFPDLKPGVYMVGSNKPQDFARAAQPATVVAGKTTEVVLELKR